MKLETITRTFLNTVNGRHVPADATFESFNPATGEVIGHVARSSVAQVHDAVAAARAAQPAWAARPDAERKALMLKVAQTIEKHAEELALWVTREQGKPLGGLGPGQVPGSRFEVMGCKVWTEVPASLDLAPEVVFEDSARRDTVYRKPFGVVAAIAPWNWPLLIAIWQMIPAVRAGNTVVIKPSEHTSIGTLELVRLISAELPVGVINSVSGGGDVGAALVEHPDVDKIMFTGSSATGAKIAATAARLLKPTTLELGGNDAAIVMPDADPKAIAMDLFWGAFINMGQTCACAKRVYVHESLHDELVSELQAIAEAVPMGEGTQEGMAMGPVQNRMQFDKVVSLVESARQAGARIVCGGHPSPGAGHFFPLTLVTGLGDGSPLVDEEQFGPVLPIVRYSRVEDAIASANRLRAGLGASVWSSDLEAAREVASRMDAGTVWINQHGTIHPMVPFGGIKGSGWGVEFGLDGLKAVTQAQVISERK
ncbi:aldehyde dehydrogenase family protein [Hydrogenophaga sp.]|uniref:aldehyde dehydrogenase family protein n=1 Tax=Hydrogenophaga sp. TaxID=1904254 RepID=UPI003F6E7EBB